MSPPGEDDAPLSPAERAARAFALGLLLLLLGMALGHLPFAPSEFTLNGLITAALGFAALRLLGEPLRWRFDAPFLGLLGLLVWTVLRALTGPSIYLGALELGRELPLMALAWTLASRDPREEEPGAMLRVGLVASLAVVAAACVPEVTGDVQDMPASWADPSLYQALTFRLTSVFDNPNLLGVFLAGILPFALVRALRAPASGAAAGWGLVFVAASTMMLFSFSRGGWVGAAAGLVLAAYHLLRFERATVRRHRLLWLALGLVPAILAGRAALGERLGQSGKAGELGIHQRLALIESTLALTRAHLVAGAGTNAYELVMTRYRNFGGYYPREAHGMPLQVAAELGLVGLAAWALLMVGVLGMREGEGEARAALAAFLAASCFISSGRYLALKILGWIFAGWAAAPSAEAHRRPVPAWARGVLGMGVVMTSLYLWGFIALAGMGSRGFDLASMALPFADDLVYMRAIQAYRSGNAPRGRELLQRARSLNPAQSRYALELGRDALMRDELADARRWIASVREMDPFSEEGMRLEAQLKLKEKDPRGALLLLEAALETNPQYLRINRSTYPTIVFMLIAMHRKDGDPARAAALEKEFADILPKSP